MKKQAPVKNGIENLLSKKKYDFAYKLAKNENKVNELLKLMTTNHHCNHAYSILKAENLNFLDFPELQERIMKKYVRYLQKTFEWEQIELRLISSKQLLAYYSEDLQYNHGKPEERLRDIALSLVERHGLKEYVKKKELFAEIGQKFAYHSNLFTENDEFSSLISSD